MFGGRRGRDVFAFFFFVFLIFDFASDEVEEIGMSALEKGVTEDILGWVFAALVEAVHVKLTYEGVDVTVSEVFG